ncbi:MAG: Peptide deformylase [Alphaproteobacteria bacterium MarineAlpha5_Bin9]|mgnify:CR=1 FL=1|nr:MAG: Peptide deformylase [Alphaproteobacteria bacterium MarineAlpha5_Bin9]|tara:strand:+ start:2721 stop:3257 length:537 start_codon:yes stop_codon:yes gene_type:complete
MSILKIALLGHPILYKKASLIKKLPDPKINDLIRDMAETMIEYNGIGLAAPQVHVSKQIIIFRNLENKDVDEKNIQITPLINPVVKNITDEKEIQWEGCLSVPGMSGLVERYTEIEFEGYDVNGNTIKSQAKGLQARVIQHEYDHLKGILYLKHLKDVKAFGFSEEIEKYWKNNDEKK